MNTDILPVIVLCNISTNSTDVSLSTAFSIRCTFLKLHSVVSDNDSLPAVSLIRKNTPGLFRKCIAFQQAVQIDVYHQPALYHLTHV